MKKLYILFFTLICTVALNANTTDSEPTFIIANFNAPTTDEGVVHTETKYDAGIEIKFRNVTQKQWNGILYPSCLEEPLYDTKYFEMVNENTIDPDSEDHSFLEIKSTGKANIERVEFIAGAAARASRLTCAVSIDGSDYLNDYVLTGTALTIRKPITFAAPNGEGMQMCGASYFYEVPESIEYNTMWGGSGPAYTEFRKEAKYIRLNWGSKQFAGTANKKGDPVNLFAIKIYTDADKTGTSIENNKYDEFQISLAGLRITTEKLADILVYSTHGELVLSKTHTQDVDLSLLTKGIYIIKAQAIDKKQTVVKKIIL